MLSYNRAQTERRQGGTEAPGMQRLKGGGVVARKATMLYPLIFGSA